MFLDFPSLPATGDIYTFGSRSWSWNGTGWLVYGTSSTSVSGVSDVNGITGSVGITSATYIQISQTGNTLTISALEPPLIDGGLL